MSAKSEKLVASLAKALKSADLSIEDRALLTTLILDKVGALPLQDLVLIHEGGTLSINGKQIDGETARNLQQSAKAALRNSAMNLIRQQVLFTAITIGVHKLERVDQSFFARAAIWFGQQEELYLKLLAQEDPGQNLLEDAE